MPDDATEQTLNSTGNEAGGRIRELEGEVGRLRLEADLSEALSEHISGPAVGHAARLLAGKVKRNQATGELYHENLGVGIRGVVAGFLNSEGNYLLGKAGRDAGGSAPVDGSAGGQAPAKIGGGWDIERAVKDVKYNAEWKAADPDGHAKAWNEHITKLGGGIDTTFGTRGFKPQVKRLR